MGCFTVLKSKKKKSDQSVHNNRVLPQESTPTTLPEPKSQNLALQSAPPSFRTRLKPLQPTNNVASIRMRALSAPSSLHGPDRDTLSSVEIEDLTLLEQRSPSPQPLPLPSPQTYGPLKPNGSFKAANTSGPLKSAGSFKAGNASGHLYSSGPLYASGPLPLPPSGAIRSFSFEEIVSACYNFSSDSNTSESLSSTTYRASFSDVSSTSKKMEASVTRFYTSTQGVKEFINEINKLATLQYPNLCKLLGYHATEGSEQRILVYERLHHGSLDRFLYGRSDGPPLDWNARVKVALCAAQGLTFLHEEGPFQAMYNEFSTVNIQIDKDFSAKLSGYGCVGLLPDADLSDSSPAIGNLSVETVERGILTPKSNVYSFGIVLLELLTGRKNMGSHHPKEERNLVKWCWPFLADDSRLSLIMDQQLKGRFPIKAARTVADVAHRCLQKDPSERPTMRTVVDHLKTIQDLKHSCRFPLQEPAAVAGKKQMFRSPSLPPRQSLSHSSSISASTQPAPGGGCSSLVALDEVERQETRRLSASSSGIRRTSVEGF